MILTSGTAQPKTPEKFLKEKGLTQITMLDIIRVMVISGVKAHWPLKIIIVYLRTTYYTKTPY